MPGKEEDRWRAKDEGVLLFKRWRRTGTPVEAPATTPATAPNAQPSDLLKFLAIVSYLIFTDNLIQKTYLRELINLLVVIRVTK